MALAQKNTHFDSSIMEGNIPVLVGFAALGGSLYFAHKKQYGVLGYVGMVFVGILGGIFLWDVSGKIIDGRLL